VTQRRARVALSCALALALVCALLIANMEMRARTGAGAAAHTSVPPTAADTAVPPSTTSVPPAPTATPRPPDGPGTAHLVHSINIGEYGCGDPFISDATLRGIVASHHIPYIRAPFRDGCTDAQYLEMLKAIVGVGAVPQVTIHGNCTNSPSQQTEGDHWLTLLDQASAGVYWVEYGNEEDVGCGTGGISVQQYVAGWNRDIPLFAAHHPRARFIGPVTAGHNTGWIDYLLANGIRHPDAVSWHWYPCGGGVTDSQCLTNTGHIDNDIAQTDAYEAQVGVPAPIWITEWDEDYTSDARFGNKTYIQNWMALATQHLSHLHDTANLAVAEFYVLTNGSPKSQTDLCYPPPSDTFTDVGSAFFAGIPSR
jgi:Glycosyl hydrolase catalytic core